MTDDILLIPSPEDEGMRLDVFVAANTDLTRSAAQKLIESGSVTAEGEEVSKRRPVKPGEVIRVSLPEPKLTEVLPQDIPLDIIYEDSSLIVVNKPKGMVVHPAPGNPDGTLVNALLYHCGDSLSGINGVIRPGIVHRIDRDTSGLLVVAKTDAAHLSLAARLADRHMERHYEAVAVGSFREESGSVDAPVGRHPVDRKRMAVVPGGRHAVTHYRVIRSYATKSLGSYSHIGCSLETGRTHQIRVHLASLGHRLVGDELYSGSPCPLETKYPAVRAGQCLHARTLAFEHPITGEYMRFDSPLPAEFAAVLDILEKNI
ncbi:MAG: RluA family pseudouridine synthase [Clostridiales bacterium]|nr:RluA family pseudouridine synthase [Clostridiales bacterium]